MIRRRHELQTPLRFDRLRDEHGSYRQLIVCFTQADVERALLELVLLRESLVDATVFWSAATEVELARAENGLSSWTVTEGSHSIRLPLTSLEVLLHFL